MATLEISNLQAAVAEEGGETILQGVDLEVASDEIHALMGPNGSGKSTLAKVVAGHPAYEVTGGAVRLHLEGEEFDEEIPEDMRTWELLDLEPNERAALGIFLGFQYPAEIEGVTMVNFLRTALNAKLEEREELFEDASRTRTPPRQRRTRATRPPRWRGPQTRARSASRSSRPSSRRRWSYLTWTRPSRTGT